MASQRLIWSLVVLFAIYAAYRRDRGLPLSTNTNVHEWHMLHGLLTGRDTGNVNDYAADVGWDPWDPSDVNQLSGALNSPPKYASLASPEPPVKEPPMAHLSDDDIAQKFNIAAGTIRDVIETLGLASEWQCHVAHALPLDELDVPIGDLRVLPNQIGSRGLRDKFFIELEDGNINRLPGLLRGLDARNMRWAEKEWDDVIAIADKNPKKLTPEDGVYLLAGLGRFDLQVLGKAIVFPDLVSTEERRTAMGYPEETLADMIRGDVLGTPTTEDELLIKAAQNPRLMSREECDLVRSRFRYPLGQRDGLGPLPSIDREDLHWHLVATGRYVPCGEMTFLGSYGRDYDARRVAERFIQTEIESTAIANCAMHDEEQDVVEREQDGGILGVLGFKMAAV